jgi:hypothetical protein
MLAHDCIPEFYVGKRGRQLAEWQELLKLNPGETLNLRKSSTKGFMEETDIMEYDILDSNGQKVGSIEIEDHTAVRGFRRTVHVLQRSTNGNVVLNETWTG